MLTQTKADQIARIAEGLSVLHKIASSRAGSSSAATSEYLEELRQKLVSEDFYLVVLGLFKRGKSTLINALLQSEVLPVGVVPVTSVITLMKYGREPMANVSFAGGVKRKIEISELPEYVTEKGNPGNAKGVREVEVRVPSATLKSGVTIIDTPGVGSTFMGGTRTTYQFLEKADACIFTLAVDPPIGQSEVDLLKAIMPHAKKLIFVLNKKDYADEPSVGEAVSFCREVIQPSLGISDVPVYPISAKWAIEGYEEADSHKVAESGLPELMEVLDSLVRSEKQEILIASTATKALKAAEDLRVSQEIALKSVQMPLNRLEEALKRVDEFLKVVETKKREIFYLLDGKSKEIVQMLDEDLETFKREHATEFLTDLETYAREALGSKRNTRETASMLEDRLGEELKTVFSDFATKEEEKITSSFSELADTFGRQVDLLVGSVQREVSTLFGVKRESSAPGVNLTSEHRFYFQSRPFSQSGLTFVGDLSGLLPKFMMRGTLLKKFIDQAREAFEGTGGRIRYDYFVVRLDKGVIGLKREVGALLDSSILAARDAVVEGERMHSKSNEEVESALKELNRTLGEIQSVKYQLGQLARGSPDPEARMPSGSQGAEQRQGTGFSGGR